MTLRTACSCTTGCTESASSYAWNLVATGAFEFGQIDSRLVPLIELVVELISWSFHAIENVKAPIYSVEVVCMFIGANVAHSSVTTTAKLKTFNIGVLILIMDSTC